MIRVVAFVLVCASFIVTRVGWAQIPTFEEACHYEAEVVDGDGTPTVTSYFVDPVTSASPHCKQEYRLYLPKDVHDQPAGGWPVVIDLEITGFAVSSPVHDNTIGGISSLPMKLGRSEEAQQRLGTYLRNGFAVVTASATLSFDEMPCGGGSTDPVQGGGMFHPPGLTYQTLGLDSSHAWASWVPYERFDVPSAEKDAVMLIQHVRGEIDGLDDERVAVAGTSAGAIALMWAAFGPERNEQAPFDTSYGGQFEESTVPDAAVLRGGVVWWPIFSKNLQPTCGGASRPSHFSDDGDPLVPFVTLGETSLGPGANLVELMYGSALVYDQTDDFPVYMIYDETSRCTDVVPNATCTPPLAYCFDFHKREGDPAFCVTLGHGNHPAWSGYAWEYRHPDDTRLVVTEQDVADLDYGPADEDALIEPFLPDVSAGGSFAHGPLVKEAALHEDAVSWVRQQFGLGPSPWATIHRSELDTDEHVGVPGINPAGSSPEYRIPQLVADGPAGPSDVFRLCLNNARPNATVHVFASDHRDDAAYFGGTMVPGDPEELTVSVTTTDADGQWVVELEVPSNAQSDDEMYFQVWIEDEDAVSGRSGSNATFYRVP